MSDALCLVCSGPSRFWMSVPRDWRRPWVAGAWRLVWCDSCHFGQVWPRPDAGDIAAFYDLARYYTHSATETGRIEARPGLAARLMLALAWRADRGIEPDAAWWQALPPAGARTALEIGCGSGQNLDRLAGLGLDVAGVEPDAAACAAARGRGLDVWQGVAEALPGPVAAQRYDLVVLTHVLEHCLNPGLALAQAAGRLAPGGRMVVEVPNNACAGARAAGAVWHWLDVPRHLNFFTEASLRALVAQAGLVVERVEWWGYARQFHPDWIATEAQSEAVFAGQGTADAARLALHLRRGWGLLARTLLAPAAQRYDSVRLILRAG